MGDLTALPTLEESLADHGLAYRHPLPRRGRDVLRVLFAYARRGANPTSLVEAFEALVILPNRER